MHLILTFGFSISTKPNSNIENDKNAIKDKVKKKIIRQRKEKEISKDTSEITESSKNVIYVGQILAEIHVEYDLFPNYNFKFDCRCWEKATKIYTENDDFCLRSIPCPINKDTCWVIFSIHHLVHLNEMQLKNFFNYVINCHIFCGKQKFSERAKKDQVKGFYMDDKSINVGQEEFLEIYPLNFYHSNSVKPSTPPLPQPIIITDEVHGDFSITTYLDVIPDSIHEYIFRKMLRKGRFPPESLKLEFIATNSIENERKLSPKQTKRSTRQNQIKKNEKGKQKHRIDTYEICLPAEALFSDMGTITSYNRTPQLPCISSILMYAQCQNILTNKQLRMNLNPISIKLEQLSNFPANIVIENGFKWIYMKILFVDRTIVTPCYIPNRIMYFEFVKCFLCEEFQPKELVKFLTTKFLTVQVIGVQMIEPSISGQPDHDKSVSKSSKEVTKEEILLGIAKFDVSDLLRGFWEVKLTNDLIHPCNIFATNIDDTDDERKKISWKNSPLTSDTFTSYSTSIKIKIRPTCDLRIIQKKIIRHENIFNRIFFNLNDLKLADDILKDVSLHNSNLLTIYESSIENNNLKTQGMLKHILTGFAIENCEKSYIFLEGLSNGYLLKIWEKVKKLPIQHKCIYYNSSYVFFTRLYEDFILLGGIIHIKLSESLDMQLRKCILYIGKTKATIQSNVIRKLGLMNLSLTMKSLHQTHLFPEPDDVKAFINDIRKIYSTKYIRKNMI